MYLLRFAQLRHSTSMHLVHPYLSEGHSVPRYLGTALAGRCVLPAVSPHLPDLLKHDPGLIALMSSPERGVLPASLSLVVTCCDMAKDSRACTSLFSRRCISGMWRGEGPVGQSQNDPYV